MFPAVIFQLADSSGGYFVIKSVHINNSIQKTLIIPQEAILLWSWISGSPTSIKTDQDIKGEYGLIKELAFSPVQEGQSFLTNRE